MYLLGTCTTSVAGDALATSSGGMDSNSFIYAAAVAATYCCHFLGLVQHGFNGGQFHPQGADAGDRVVAMGERHGREEPAGVNRWSLNQLLQ
jgi:hypothetical protein